MVLRFFVYLFAWGLCCERINRHGEICRIENMKVVESKMQDKDLHFNLSKSEKDRQ